MRSCQRGSAAVETVLLAPAVLLLATALVGGGRVLSDKAAVRAVAREAARAAVVASTPAEAVALGRAAGLRVASGYGLKPERLRVAVIPGAFRRGGALKARVSYSVSLLDLPSFGLLPARLQLGVVHVEPIDRHASR